MTTLGTLIQDLVIANRIVRHPEDPSRFLIARSVSLELVTAEDIV
jgi:hypothetical protein